MPVYSVSQITRYLKDSLEADFFLNDLWMRGEVSNLTRSAAGHFYFTLKDSASQVRCVMFRPAHGGEHLAEGGAVIAHGRVSLYEVRGDLQLIADLAQPEGVGELHLELERLKVKLEAEGLFLGLPQETTSRLPQAHRSGDVSHRRGLARHPEHPTA